MVKIVATEHQEQVAVMEWARLQEKNINELSLLYAVPNGGDRHPAVAAKLRAEGVKPGVPDLHLPVPRGAYHSLYIEMKRVKGGTVTAEQRAWHKNLRLQGHLVEVCRGADEAILTIRRYLDLSKTSKNPWAYTPGAFWL